MPGMQTEESDRKLDCWCCFMLNRINKFNPNKRGQTTGLLKGWLDPAGNFHDMGKDAHVSWMQKHMGIKNVPPNQSDIWDQMMSKAYGDGWVRIGDSGAISMYYSDLAISNTDSYIKNTFFKHMDVIVNLEDKHVFCNLKMDDIFSSGLKKALDKSLQL